MRVASSSTVAATGTHTGWNWVYLTTDFCTLADWSQPNNHLGLIPKSVALDDRAREHIVPHDVTNSPYARFGALLTDRDVAELIDKKIRLGRTQTIIDRSGEEYVRGITTCDPQIFADLVGRGACGS